MDDQQISIPALAVQGLKELVSELSFRNIFIFLLSVCVITRIVTGVSSRITTIYQDSSVSVKKLPYWIPYIGHGLSLAFRRQSLLENASSSNPGTPFSLHCWGRTHTMITTSSSIKSLSQQKASTSAEPCISYLMKNVFGSSKKLLQSQEGGSLTESPQWMDYLTQERHLAGISSSLAREIERAIPNFVSFSTSVVDQCVWERLSRVEVRNDDSGGLTCEANLFSLIRDFVGSISTDLLLGKAFGEVFPNELYDLWTVNNKFNPMALGIKRWVPFPGLPTAYGARRRLLACLTVFHKALTITENGQDAGIDWSDMDDVSEAIKVRSRERTSRGYSAEAAASEDMALIWAINAKTNTIIFWNLVHILANPQLHARIMKEIAPYSKASRPGVQETGFLLPEPPRLALNMEGLIKSCPLLKATCDETFRHYSLSFTYRKVITDLTLTESNEDPAIVNRDPHVYRISAGEYVAVPYSIYNRDPYYHHEPALFDPHRYMAVTEQSSSSIQEASQAPESSTPTKTETDNLSKQEPAASSSPHPEDDIWSNGWDEPVSKFRDLETRKVMSFVAAFLAMWDIEPADGKQWKVPAKANGSLVSEPKRDIRVKLKSKV